MAFTVSLLIHAALIVKIPIDIPDISKFEEPKSEPPLQVRIAPPLVAPPSPPPVATPRVRPRIVPPSTARAPQRVPPARTPIPETALAGDLASYIAARQRERTPSEESVATPPQVEDANARANRIAAANLTSERNLTFGFDPSRSGGVFLVTRLSLDYGEFLFYGWNLDMGRRTQQEIEVRRGTASDIRVAIVRKMIEIIRREQPVEFVWESRRLGRSLTLSSRVRDNSGLEDFMMQEFFESKR